MTTNPSGLCFISYRRTRTSDIALLVDALHEHGVPTWQDVTNLAEEPLEPALRDVLNDPNTASAVLWITPEISESVIVTGVEIPALGKRSEAGDAFCLIPVIAGGLDYGDAGRVARSPVSLINFSTWNIMKVENEPMTADDARTVARNVLTRRLAAVNASADTGSPLVLDFFTRGPVAKHADAALTIDFTHLFTGRLATPDSWTSKVLPALSAVLDSVATEAPGRSVQLRGLVGLPAAVALGSAALGPRGSSTAWMQYTPGRPMESYSLGAKREASGFSVSIRDGNPRAEDIAVSVNVTDTTSVALQRTTTLPDFRGYVQADPPGKFPHDLSSAGVALDVVDEVVTAMKAARARYGKVGDVHLFIAGPVGLAFLLGQRLNTFGPVQTYEFVSDDGAGRYVPAAYLRPSS